MQLMATILDVANEAGVSVATVSRVLNNSYVVTQEKKKRVMDAVSAVGYEIPPRMKINRELAPPKSCVLIITSALIEDIIFPLQNALEDFGYQVVTISYISQLQIGSLEEMVRVLEPNLAGVVLLNAIDASPKFQALLEKYPMVQIGEPIMEKVPNTVVYIDEVMMSQDAANFFLDMGRRKVAIFIPDDTSDLPLFVHKKRLQGYYLAMLEHKLPIDKELIVSTDLTIDGSFEAVSRLLDKRPDVDAIVACVDVVAQGALYAVRAAGMDQDHIPILSMGQNENWSFAPNNIHYIDLHHEDIAASAARVLHSVISGEISGDCRVIINHTIPVVNKGR